MSGLTCLRRYYDPEEAFVVKSALEAAGVNAILIDECHLGANPALRIGLGGYRLSVPAHEEAAALEALAELESFECDEPIGADVACLNCGGRKFRRMRSMRWTAVAFLTGSAFAAQNRHARCLSCGETVNYDDRPLTSRLFFFLSSMAILAFIAWQFLA